LLSGKEKKGKEEQKKENEKRRGKKSKAKKKTWAVNGPFPIPTQAESPLGP
jgi:hypothetical protein